MKIETGSRLYSEHFPELAKSLLASPEVAARATLLADAVRKALPNSACALYSLRPSTDGASWTTLGVSDGISVVEASIAEGCDAPSGPCEMVLNEEDMHGQAAGGFIPRASGQWH